MGVFVCAPLADSLKDAAAAVAEASTAVALVAPAGSGIAGAAAPQSDPLSAALGAARAALECLVPLAYRPATKAALLDLGCVGALSRLLARLVPLTTGSSGRGGDASLALSASAAATMALEACAALCDPAVCLDPSAAATPALRAATCGDGAPRAQGASLAAVVLASLASMGGNAHVARSLVERSLLAGSGSFGASLLAAGAARWRAQAEGKPKEEFSSLGTSVLLFWAAEKLRESVGNGGGNGAGAAAAGAGGVAEVVEAVASSLERAASAADAEGAEAAPPPPPVAPEPAPRRFAAAVSASRKAEEEAAAAAASGGQAAQKDDEGEEEDIFDGADLDDDDDDEGGDDDENESDPFFFSPFLEGASGSSSDPVSAAAAAAFDAPSRIFWRNVAARAADGAPPVVPLELPSSLLSSRRRGLSSNPAAAASPLLAWDLPPAQRLEPATAALADGLACRKRARGASMAEVPASVEVERLRAERLRARRAAAAAAEAAEAAAAAAPIAVIEPVGGGGFEEEEMPPGV
jgi:hypothetical protein